MSITRPGGASRCLEGGNNNNKKNPSARIDLGLQAFLRVRNANYSTWDRAFLQGNKKSKYSPR